MDFIRTLSFIVILASKVAVAQTNKHIARVDQMSEVPKQFNIIDYRKLATRFDQTVYDFKASGKLWPLIWIDSSQKNYPQPTIGLYTAMGDKRQGPQNNKGMFHEALASMGAVLGASLVGIDKSRQEWNYVAMLKNYFNKETGWNIMMNNTCPDVAKAGGGYGRDWWYDVFPNVLFYAIYDLYPHEPGFDQIAKTIADQFYSADSILNGNYTWSYFDYSKMIPVKNDICPQPDAAAGHAWVLYNAYKKFGDPRYLKGAQSALAALQSQTRNPTYELLMPFGAYMAARLGAECGRKYDIDKMLAWSFDGKDNCRDGWGVLVGDWNGYDISGIVGSTVDHGGYGFLMNTYDAAWPLVPLVRYDSRCAAAIGKWMLHAANACRLFYPENIPQDHQTLPESVAITKGVIAYEGLIRQSSYKEFEHLQAPVAQGDGPFWVADKNPPESQFSVYGSAHAGIFGSIIRTTNVPGILRLDLLATDFFHDKAFPSFLYYNPYSKAKQVVVDISDHPVDLYDAVTKRFVARNVNSSFMMKLGARSAVVFVITPPKGKITQNGNKLLVDDVIIDYHFKD